MSRLTNAWRNLVQRRRVEQDLDAELHATLDLLIDEHVRGGMSLEDARRAAHLEFGAVEALKDNVRDTRAGNGIESFLQDVRFALRSLRRTKGFSAVALMTLALCTGANAAVFSIVNGVLLRPLPYPVPERLVRLFQDSPRARGQRGTFEGAASLPDLEDWQARARAFEGTAGSLNAPQILTGRGDPVELEASYVTGDFFQVLGVPATLGRSLSVEDFRLATRNVVISDRAWHGRLGGDVRAIGQRILLRGEAFTIVGVMPAAFRYPTPDTDVWLPESVLGDNAVGPQTRGNRFLAIVARMKPGVTLAQAREDINRVTRRLAVEYPQSNRGWDAAAVVPLRTTLVGDVSVALMLSLGGVGFVLLIGCANLANLLLARTSARSHEIAIRAALGAGRGRIVRQFLTESLTLAALGGALGAAVAFWGVPAILALSADTLPRVDDVRVDVRVGAFLVAVVLVTAVLCAFLPARQAARLDPHDELRGHGTIHRTDRRWRSGLVIGEVAVAVLLVVGAGLMVRSLLALRSVNPGFDPDHALAVRLQWNLAGVPDSELARHLVQRRDELIERVKALPGVIDAGTITSLPLQGQCGDFFEFFRADGTGAPDGSPLRANSCLISSTYLTTMRIPLVRGDGLPRDLPPSGAALPVLVNQAAAQRFWPGQDVVGLHLQFPPRFPVREAVVVGVVGDVHQLGLAAEPPPLFYADQRVGPRLMTTLVVRAAGDPLLLSGGIRQVVRGIDPNQPIRNMETLREVMADSIRRDRFFTWVFGVFGALALMLAAVGIYGVLAYSIGQRKQEIAVQMALGARAADVLVQVVGGAMRLVSVGLVLGVAAALVLARVLTSQLYDVSITDPLAFAAAVATLTTAALIACAMPAWRAVHIEPMDALREE